MTTHKLIPYWLTLRETRNPGFQWDLEEIIYSPATLDRDSIIDIFADFCNYYLGDDPSSTEILRKAQNTFTLEGYRRENRTLQGIMLVGGWGEGANHFNVEQEHRTREARTRNDSAEIPYYFMVHLPERDTKRALFIIQKPGNYGAKGTLESVLKIWLHNKIHFDLNAIMSDDLLEQILQADRILRLKLKKDRIAEAPHQRLGSIFESEREVKQVVEFSAQAGQSLPLTRENPVERIRELLSRYNDITGSNNTSPATTTILDEEFDDAVLSIEEDGSTRSFSIENDEVTMQRIIDPELDNISFNSLGHPKPKSMSRVAVYFANNILSDHQEPTLDEGIILDNGTI